MSRIGWRQVSVEKFISSMKETLGSAWNDQLIEPAKAFHAAASRNIATTKAQRRAAHSPACLPASQPVSVRLLEGCLMLAGAAGSRLVQLGRR